MTPTKFSSKEICVQQGWPRNGFYSGGHWHTLTVVDWPVTKIKTKAGDILKLTDKYIQVEFNVQMNSKNCQLIFYVVQGQSWLLTYWNTLSLNGQYSMKVVTLCHTGKSYSYWKMIANGNASWSIRVGLFAQPTTRVALICPFLNIWFGT